MAPSSESSASYQSKVGRRIIPTTGLTDGQILKSSLPYSLSDWLRSAQGWPIRSFVTVWVDWHGHDVGTLQWFLLLSRLLKYTVDQCNICTVKLFFPQVSYLTGETHKKKNRTPMGLRFRLRSHGIKKIINKGNINTKDLSMLK